MLKVLYADHKKPDADLSFQDVLLQMREILKESRYTQIPQLTSSRQLDVSSPFEIVPEGNTGTKRAVIIGINYVGQQGELSGCHNDAKNMMEYIKGKCVHHWVTHGGETETRMMQLCAAI